MPRDESAPRATLEDVWREHEAWGRAARDGKKKQEAARLCAVILGVAGALLGAVVVYVERVPDFFEPASSWAQVVFYTGVASPILIALSGYLGRELLTPDRETQWARARLLVEALKREGWRYQMRVPPYDGDRPHEVLRARADEMARNRGLERPEVAMDAPVEPPSAATVEEYLDNRVLEQARWYEKRSGEHRAQRDRLNRSTFLLGAFTVVLGFVGSRDAGVLVFVPVLTTATAALVAWIQGSRVGSMVALYQETSSQLRLRAAAWRDDAATRQELSEEELSASEIRLVESCEEIMARENGAWRAEWLDEEKAKEAEDALREVQQAAQNSTGQTAPDTKP